MAKRRPRNDTHDRVEDLALYKYMMDLTNYMYMVLLKFPKSERMMLTQEIKVTTLQLMRSTIEVGVTHDKAEGLVRMNCGLKYLKVLVRIAFLKNYINEHRLEVWATKITDADKIVAGWGRRMEAGKT